jgi:hypothetical protein
MESTCIKNALIRLSRQTLVNETWNTHEKGGMIISASEQVVLAHTFFGSRNKL